MRLLMKKNWQAVMVISAMSIIFGNVSFALAQQDAIAGAYGGISNTDPEVVSAASFAVSAQGRRTGAPIALLSIERAEVQVVAGLNYRLRLKVKANGQTQDVITVVYKNLKQKHSFSGWETSSSGPGGSGAVSPNPTIQQLAKSVADAFTAKTLGSLDAENLLPGKLRIVIEHSLGDDKDGFEIKNFKTLEQAEQWLQSRESDGSPGRNSGPLQRCSKGVCTFEQTGMLHNNLYLKKISYGLRRGRPHINSIYLLDGD
jgi:cystatin-C